MRDQLFKVLKSPITGLLVGTCVAIVLFLAGQKEVQPRYATSEPELLAEITDRTPRLKLLWDGMEVPNIYSQKIAIWNDGRRYLDKSNISKTDQIKVIPPNGTHLLFYKFTNTSRKDLNFKLNIQNNNSLLVEFEKDEALEYKDGGLLSILYTGESTDPFKITARIKGVPEGFKKVKWKNIAQKKNEWKDWLSFAVFFMNFIFIIIYLSTRSKWRTWKLADFLPVIFIAITSLYMLYDKLSPLLFGVSWAY